MSSELVTLLRQQSKVGPINVPRAAMRDAAAHIEALEAEVAQMAKALQSVETQADNAAWNIGRQGHKFTPADIQAGYFNIRDFARRAREGGNADG